MRENLEKKFIPHQYARLIQLRAIVTSHGTKPVFFILRGDSTFYEEKEEKKSPKLDFRDRKLFSGGQVCTDHAQSGASREPTDTLCLWLVKSCL